MKKLSIEEKAKAYDEVLERAREEYEIYKGVKDVYHCEALERIFHKLAESEDEKIRKALINTIKELADEAYVEDGTGGDFWAGDYNSEEIIAWLENQGEQKPQIKLVFPKFRVGDIIQHIPLKKWDTTKKITHIDETGYYFDYSHQGDTISRGFIGFSFENDYELVEQKPALSEEDEAVLDALIRRLEGEDIHVSQHLAVKCLKSLKNKVQPQPNQEWSEEDNVRIEQICEDLKCGLENFYSGKNVKGLHYEEIIKSNIDWLKSLKDKYTWKPSDEQMKVLVWCMPLFADPKSKGILKSLIEDLKKLKK